MRSRVNLPVFIAYLLIGLLAVTVLALQMGGEFVFGGYRVNAIFKTGADLVAGDDVTMSGLRVGKIESLAPIAGATRVSMLLHGDFTPVFRDARAVIRQKNLLGEAYVEVNRGTAAQGRIADGGTIDQCRKGQSFAFTPLWLDIREDNALWHDLPPLGNRQCSIHHIREIAFERTRTLPFRLAESQ